MSIKSQGGVFGRNPTFNDVTVEGDLSIDGTLTIGGETITGLSYQGGWNASTNTPDIAASSPVTGQFWIVSADGSTNVGGITNWTSGDWALYDGSNWQRVEGGNTDLTTGVQGQLAIANGGTGAADAATARTNLGLGTAATTASTDYATAAQGTTADSALQPADIGSTVQGYDADIAKYDDTTANFTGTLQNGGSNVVVDSDIGSTVQAYDADTAKLDVAQTWTATQEFAGIEGDTLSLVGGDSTSGIRLSSDTSSSAIFVVGTSSSEVRLTATSYGGYTPMHFYTGGSAKLSVYNSGNVVVSSGNLIIGTAGKGIDFSATSDASGSTSELLDDYEEGVTTVTLTPNSSGSITLNGSVNTLSYTKVGRLVTLTGLIEVSSVSSPSGSYVTMGGLPFVTAASGGSLEYGNRSMAILVSNDTTSQYSGFIGDSSTSINFFFNASTVTSSSGFYLNFSYITA